MSQRSANCPNCGAPVQYRWSSAIQTVCPYCRSILVRTDVDLAKVGEVADLPVDSSPIQLGVEGIYRNKAFVVVGRIVYEYELGNWNEWHLVFNDNTSGWLSDAQLEYAVSMSSDAGQALPAATAIARGQRFQFHGVSLDVTTLTRAHYRGVEGDLPFEYWDKTDVLFADLRGSDARFGTIDYSEVPPLLFLGETVEFEDLRMSRLREFEGWKR